jgi:hypothetical protein
VMLNGNNQFGPTAFTGDARFLEIAVRCPAGGGGYTNLTPRQRLSAAPYALSLKPEAEISATVTGTMEAPGRGVLSVNNGLVGNYCDWAVGLRATAGSGSTGTVFCDDASVYGNGTSAGVLGTGDLYGVAGVSRSTTGWGLFARADGNNGRGVFVSTGGAESTGILVQSGGITSTGISVQTWGGASTALYAINYSTNITSGLGIYGVKGDTSGYDILENYWFPGAVVGDSDTANGVMGVASGGSAIGVVGIITGTADRAVAGYAMATTGYTFGVLGTSNSSNGIGVYGSSRTGVSGSGYAYGVYGQTYSTVGIGVVGLQSGYSMDDLSDFWAPGGGFAGQNGIVAVTKTDGGYGVAGMFAPDTGYGAGVRGRSYSPNAYAVYGINQAGGYAGYFSGNVHVIGNFTASGTKAFLIDYPLDPANKYLYHYAVESPQVQNLYNGTIALDANGEVVVDLPVYFSAVNAGPFQYQLTAIGAPGPNLYIAQEVAGNQFKIAGGAPGMKVSWQLLGMRNDPWIQDHPQTDVADKPAGEVGKYLYPQGYGQPATLQIGFLEQTNPLHLFQPVAPQLLPQTNGTSGTLPTPQQPNNNNVPGSSTSLPQP